MRTKGIIAGLAVALLAVGLLLGCGGSKSPPRSEQEEPTLPPEEGPTPAAPTTDGAAILESQCTKCHSLDRVKQARKSPEEWMVTVTRMIANGAELSHDQVGILVGYLGGAFGP